MTNKLGAVVLVMSILLCGSAHAMDWRDSPLDWRNSVYGWDTSKWRDSPLNWRNSGYGWDKSKWRGNPLNWRNSGYRWDENQWRDNPLDWRNSGYGWDTSKWKDNPLNWQNSGYRWHRGEWRKSPLYWRNLPYRWDVSLGPEDYQEINLRIVPDLGKDIPGAPKEVEKILPPGPPKTLTFGKGEKTSESFKKSTTYSESTEWYIAVSGSNGTDGIYWHVPSKK